MTKQELKKEYRKQRHRIQQFIRTAKKRGYEFNSVLPPIPKKITQGSINRLKKLTPQKLYDKSIHVSHETGEVESGKKFRKKEKEQTKKVAVQKRKETLLKKKIRKRKKYSEPQELPTLNTSKIILRNYFSSVSQYQNSAYPVLTTWIEKLIQQYGEEDAAQMIIDGEESGVIVTREIAYSDELLRGYMSRMIAYLPEIQGFERDKLLDSIDEFEEWFDYD